MQSTTVRALHQYSALLWLWVPLAILVGLALPTIRILQPFSILLLAVIVGGIAITLELPGFRKERARALPVFLLGHLLMAPIAWILGRLLGLDPVHVAGLVLLGASTPDLTAPLLARIARGRTHQIMLLLVTAGTLSVLWVPVTAHLLIDPALRVPLGGLLTVVIAGIAIPGGLGILLHAPLKHTVPHIDAYGTALSTTATILVTAVIAAANRDVFLTTDPPTLLTLLGAAFLLYLAGLALGFFLEKGPLARRTTGPFLVGTREYALAATFVIAAGFPTQAAVIPLLFGGLQMVLAPLLAHRMAKQAAPGPGTHR